MNLDTQNAKNIISKDNELSKKAACEIINNIDIKSFETLCKNSNQFYDFITDKIIKNLLHATNKNNINSTFEFAKFYDNIIGQYINQAWLKFANDDLTDEILEIFENGTENQKIYAAKYFANVNDSLALELLRKYAFCENNDLSSACAYALRAFKDEASRKNALNLLQENDVFKKYNATKFLINFGNIDDLRLIISEFDNTAFSSNITEGILYNYDFESLKNILTESEILKLYDELISSYPEDITLETVYEFNLDEVMEKFLISKNSYTARILADAKNVFNLINSDTIYTYDLDKNSLNAIYKINSLLKNYHTNSEFIAQELDKNQKRALRALNTLIIINDKSANDKILSLYNNTNDPLLLCECARASKALELELDKNSGIEKIKDKNALELFKSYF